MTGSRLIAITSLLATLSTWVPVEAAAQVQVVRRGEENPVKSVFKSTLYGGGAGLLLGLATSLLVDDEDAKEETVKWFFVGGTFFGFGYGIYHVTHRPEPRAALTLRRSGTFAPAATDRRGTARDGALRPARRKARSRSGARPGAPSPRWERPCSGL